MRGEEAVDRVSIDAVLEDEGASDIELDEANDRSEAIAVACVALTFGLSLLPGPQDARRPGRNINQSNQIANTALYCSESCPTGHCCRSARGCRNIYTPHCG